MTETRHRPLPITVEEITRDWLTAALRTRTPDVTVRDFEVVDVNRGTCTKIRLRLSLDEAGKRAGIPELVILKGGFEAHARELSHMHEREVRGYRDVIPAIGLPTPTCHFADYDPERLQGIVIMDDLVARGVTFCHAQQPQSFEQVARRLGVLARFHAHSWASPDIEAGGRWGDLPNFFEAMQGFFERYVAPETWQRFTASPRGAAVSVRFHDRDWMAESWARLRRYSDGLPHCVLHGDIHLGNLYIEADGTPGFLDTLASLGPGMLEVSYHVSASIDSADRARWEGALVQHYLDELVRHGARAPSFDEAMRQYGILLVYGLFIWMTTESQYQPEAVNAANAARVSAALLDHDTLGLLESIP